MGQWIQRQTLWDSLRLHLGRRELLAWDLFQCPIGFLLKLVSGHVDINVFITGYTMIFINQGRLVLIGPLTHITHFVSTCMLHLDSPIVLTKSFQSARQTVVAERWLHQGTRTAVSSVLAWSLGGS